MQVRRELRAHFVFKNANINSESSVAQLLHSASRNFRVWIKRANDNAADSRFNNCCGAWASATGVAARFKS
jgi:hypothetical protein